MLLPIPFKAEATLRNLPVVTLVLIGINVAVFLATRDPELRAHEEKVASIDGLAGWAFKKQAQKDPPLQGLMAAYPTAIDLLCDEAAWTGIISDDDTKQTLRGYLNEYTALCRDHVYYRFGLVPASLSPSGLISHMFLHGGVLHLFFNMLFLWVVGCVLEDAWGKTLFAVIYIMSGIAAALAHTAWRPQSVEPVIGASGAVAGLMGCFAIQHARTPIRIALVYALGLVPRLRFFTVPAYYFMVFWVIEQLFFALLTVRMSLGIAFWAHLGGFVFGVLAALLMRGMRGKAALPGFGGP